MKIDRPSGQLQLVRDFRRCQAVGDQKEDFNLATAPASRSSSMRSILLNEKYFAPVWHIAAQPLQHFAAPRNMTTSGVMLLRSKAESIRLRKLSLIAVAVLTRRSTPTQFCIIRSHSRHVFAMACGEHAY
jgi:hypothetical protein